MITPNPGDVWKSRAMTLRIHSVDMSRVGEELETSIDDPDRRHRTDINVWREWQTTTGAELIGASA